MFFLGTALHREELRYHLFCPRLNKSKRSFVFLLSFFLRRKNLSLNRSLGPSFLDLLGGLRG